MASSLFIETKQAMLEGAANIAMTSGMAASLIDHTDATPDPAASGDDFYDDISAGEVATVALTGESVTNNVFDADDAVFSAVTGDAADSVVLWKDTGTPGTSRLFGFFDDFTGLPVTPGGGDITVAWHASGIFAL
jgi:hypothetical protein